MTTDYVVIGNKTDEAVEHWVLLRALIRSILMQLGVTESELHIRKLVQEVSTIKEKLTNNLFTTEYQRC
jgi:hypothetical protein